jgi:hypothetical protein
VRRKVQPYLEEGLLVSGECYTFWRLFASLFFLALLCWCNCMFRAFRYIVIVIIVDLLYVVIVCEKNPGVRAVLG